MALTDPLYDDGPRTPPTAEALNAYRTALLDGDMPAHMVEEIVLDAARSMHHRGELLIVVPDPTAPGVVGDINAPHKRVVA